MRSASETVPSVPPQGLEPTLARPLAGTQPPAAHATIDPRRYVIRSELARGGMGRISIAEDTILRRTVAIKELLSPHGPLAARFRRELALTSRLQHPSIVSIHDGGLWPTGELVYVMKLVPGESLDRVIARQASVPERLALLPHGIAVCEAIAYAHAQGIIHRDLKPANILVGEFGETVVIDWGLAKDLHEGADVRLAASSNDHVDDAETVDGDVMGTPAYMPPEQALGDAVDARADVYALGAVLYHMLAGAAPYTGRSAAAVLADVVDHAPASLAERAPGSPADLLTIVAKAMARKPEDRYATARELAGDLKRFQQGQLVAAHRYSTSQLVRRWLRKHRTAVAVAAVAVTALVVGGAISVREILQRERAAEHARGLAEQNSRDAEGLTTFMLTNLRDQLAPIGKLDLLQGVAAQVHDYYQHQPEARGAEARAGRANALRNLGDVLLARGDSAGALADYRASRELLAAQLVMTPAAESVRRDLGVMHSKIAQVHATQGAMAEALDAARMGVALLAPLAASGTPQTLSDLSNAHDMVAKLLAVQGDAEGALATFRTSLALAERRFALLPTDVSAARSLSITHNSVGDMLVDANPAEALVEYRKSEALVEGAVAREPDNATLQRDLSISHARVGDVLLPMGDVAGALRAYRAALAIAVELAAKDPTNADWQLDLTICHDDVGDALRAQGDVVAARAELEGALVVKRAMAARDPHDVTVRRNLMVGLDRVGDLALDAGERAHALALFTESRDLATRLAAEDATNTEAKLDLAKARDRVGKALEASGRLDDAIVAYRASLEARDQVAADSPDLQHGRWLARTRLGKALVVRRAYAEAQRLLGEAVAIQRELVVRSPEARVELAESEVTLGDAFAAAGDLGGARTAYREALALATAHPDDAKLAALVAPLKRRIAAPALSGRGRAARRPASRAPR